MRQKKGWIAGIAVIAVIALLFVGYNLYRYPAMFRSLSDNSLNDSQAEELREEILSQPDVDVLVSYFSYSGNTRNVAAALSEKTGGDLFEIAPLNGYSIEMSVMTEVSDLEAVMEAASEWDFADESRIVLLGTSQGGIVSAIAAARHTDQVSGLVLMYPAFWSAMPFTSSLILLRRYQTVIGLTGLQQDVPMQRICGIMMCMKKSEITQIKSFFCMAAQTVLCRFPILIVRPRFMKM